MTERSAPSGDQADAEPQVRPVILVPTYNERENLPLVLDAIFSATASGPRYEVCIIDDASPDGTGALADEAAAANDRVHVLHRAAKEGLGPAYLHGFRWALAHPRRFTHIVQMDADLSHDPKYLPTLLARCTGPDDDAADVALGSRWVPGGGIEGWSLLRLAISRCGSLYARTVLGVGTSDLTGGFKCFRRKVLETIPLSAVRTKGYGFQIEMTYRALAAGFVVREVPIVFPDRKHGVSKMSLRIFFEGASSVWRMRGALPTVPPADGGGSGGHT